MIRPKKNGNILKIHPASEMKEWGGEGTHNTVSAQIQPNKGEWAPRKRREKKGPAGRGNERLEQLEKRTEITRNKSKEGRYGISLG